MEIVFTKKCVCFYLICFKCMQNFLWNRFLLGVDKNCLQKLEKKTENWYRFVTDSIYFYLMAQFHLLEHQILKDFFLRHFALKKINGINLVSAKSCRGVSSICNNLNRREKNCKKLFKFIVWFNYFQGEQSHKFLQKKYFNWE